MTSTIATVFPETSRVIYEKNPLFEVVCQLRFPSILRIDAEPPANFQDGIRSQYPILREKPASDLPKDLPPMIARLVANELTGSAGYDFVSEDEEWTVGLTKDFVALSTSKYERWEAFRDRLNDILITLKEVYQPAFFTRIGLRYKNAIRKSVLSNTAADWTDFFKPHVLGVLAKSDVAQQVHECRSTAVIDLPQIGRVRLQTGIGKDEQTSEEVFVIDTDFFHESKTETTDVISRLGLFNRESGNLFRWCITGALSEAMGPESAS